jgi:hypothetical protein
MADAGYEDGVCGVALVTVGSEEIGVGALFHCE